MNSVAFMQRDTQLIAACNDGRLRVFDLATGACLYVFFHHSARQFTKVDMHPHGTHIVVANGNAITYVLRTGSWGAE